MKPKLKIQWLFPFLLLLLSCEKNDLCDGTDNQTPRLHISLLDLYNSENKKNVEYLKAYIEGEDIALEYTNTSELYLPLLPGTASTQWVLELYDEVGESKNLIGVEKIQFYYAPENKYISKACGFKTIFGAFSYQKSTSSNPWIGGFSLLTNTIANENSTHLQIYY